MLLRRRWIDGTMDGFTYSIDCHRIIRRKKMNDSDNMAMKKALMR
jgi:hypothetical protein